MEAHDSKVALFTGHCPIQPSKKPQNAKFIFLPANTVSWVATFGPGVIKSLKHNFRRMLINAIIKRRALDNITLQEWNVLDAIRVPNVNCGKISSQDISACSTHAGSFKHDGGTSKRQAEQVTDPDSL
jgi:hypothetical protein